MNKPKTLRQQRLGNQAALTLMLPGEVFASRGKQEITPLLDPFASRITRKRYSAGLYRITF
jgi:hypothetical protein